MVDRSTLFNAESSRIIDPVKEHRDIVLAEIFVDCFAATVPVAIVVHDQYATGYQSGE